MDLGLKKKTIFGSTPISEIHVILQPSLNNPRGKVILWTANQLLQHALLGARPQRPMVLMTWFVDLVSQGAPEQVNYDPEILDTEVFSGSRFFWGSCWWFLGNIFRFLCLGLTWKWMTQCWTECCCCCCWWWPCWWQWNGCRSIEMVKTSSGGFPGFPHGQKGHTTVPNWRWGDIPSVVIGRPSEWSGDLLGGSSQLVSG